MHLSNSQKKNIAQAHGKIILSGEYAVVFGFKGIAIPSNKRVNVTFTESQKNEPSTVTWKQKNVDDLWHTYTTNIARLLKEKSGVSGHFTIDCAIPLGKGMGSSTAIVIAMTKAALGEDCENIAQQIEDAMNPGNSGLDFAVIWNERPLVFQKGSEPVFIDLPKSLLQGMKLIDTGRPKETTPELVAWIEKKRISRAGFLPAEGGVPAEHDLPTEIDEAFAIIGSCTDRILAGENIKTVLRDHHRAQVALGVVPENVQKLIAEIERGGGAAKVLGAGARTGGGGMVLVLE